MADVDMKNVPLTAVVSDNEKVPEQERLPTSPNEDLEQLKEETGEKEQELGDTDEDLDQVNDPTIKDEPKWWILVLEALLIALLMLMPFFFIHQGFYYEEYSISIVKGPMGLNIIQEFYRITLFLVITYGLFALLPLPCRAIPWAITKFCKMTDINLGRGKKTAIKCLRSSSAYFGYAIAFLLTGRLAEYMLYEPTIEVAAIQIMSGLARVDQIKAKEFLVADKIERLLAALFVFSLWIALEKYVMSAIHYSFHRTALGPRAAQCNKKFEILGVLYRARQSGRATLSTATLVTSNKDDGDEKDKASDDKELLKDKEMGLLNAARAKTIAKEVFKVLCPPNKDVITAAEFKPYFAVNEYETAFRTFDINQRGQLDKSSFKTAVLSIYEERFRLAKGIIVNNKIIEKLNWTLLFIFGLLGLLFATVIYNSRYYSWVTSLGTFLLGFSFLFQTTMTKIFDTFVFVFVEHAYDVSDQIILDNDKFTVQKIEVFTTVFKKFDGTIMYAPNASTKGKTIYNKQRTMSEQDEINITIDASTPINQLTKIRSKLADYLTETINEFTGTVAVNINELKDDGGGGSKKAKIEVEAKYRPKIDGLRSELSLHNRRAGFLDKFMEICKEIKVDYTIQSVDK